MPVELRPLSLGELLDRTFTYYRGHFWIFVGIIAPAEIVIVVSGLVLQSFGLQSALVRGAAPSANPAQQLAMLGPFFAFISISLLVSAFVHSIALGATSLAVSKFHLGGRITIAESYRGLRGSVGRIIGLYGLYILIGIGASIGVVVGALLVGGIAGGLLRLASLNGAAAGILAGIVVMIAMLGLIVLAVMMCMRFAVAVPALVLEKLGPAKALGRSSALMKGRTGQVFLACLLMYLITLVIAAAIQTPFWVAGLLMGFKFGHNPLWLQAPATIAGGIGGAVGYPFLVIALTLFYYDARVRKEGFDLQFMLSSMGPVPLADSEALASAPEQLPETSVLLMIVLTLITAGIYVAVWFLMRLKALNRLNSSEKLGPPVFIGIIILLALSLVLAVAAPFATAHRSDTSSLSRVFDLTAGIAILVQAFKVRRILEEHVNAGRGQLFAQPVSFSGVAVFFFGVFYLQYKINGLIGVINAGQTASLDTAAALDPESPPAPTIT